MTGYTGQDVIVFDEFNSGISIQSMNNLLDCYPVTLPARYTNKQACYTKAYIISNLPLIEQYETEQYKHYEVYKAFLRRINYIIHFTDEGKYEEKEFNGGF